MTENTHRYLKDIEMREEGGTPAIIESIRAGLVFQLKDAVGTTNIEKRDLHLLRYYILLNYDFKFFQYIGVVFFYFHFLIFFYSLATESWSTIPNLIVLGNMHNLDRLPIFSFVIKHEKSDRLLHHNFVSVLLNDLFGIQSRGGCACAGPYAQVILLLKIILSRISSTSTFACSSLGSLGSKIAFIISQKEYTFF